MELHLSFGPGELGIMCKFFHVIMYSQECTSIHPLSTWMCHFWLSYSLLSLPLLKWLFLGVCIHTHTDWLLSILAQLEAKREEGWKWKQQKKPKTPSHNCGSPTVHNLGCSLGTKPGKRSFPHRVKNVPDLPELGLISSPLHHVKTESGLSDLPVDNTKMVFSPSLQHSHDSRKKKILPDEVCVCVRLTSRPLQGAHFGNECVLCVCVRSRGRLLWVCVYRIHV